MPNNKVDTIHVPERTKKFVIRLDERKRIFLCDYLKARKAKKKAKTIQDSNAVREERLGFRLDVQTKNLIERAAHLECRKITDFCVTTLADTARRIIAEHETIVLTERDRKVFFDTLINPPKINERLTRALADHKRRIIA